MRQCRTCHQDKDVGAFETRKDTGKLRGSCKACRKAYSLVRYHTLDTAKAQHNKAARKHSLKVRYGLTPEQFEDLVKEREGRCDICGCSSYQGKALTVDHSHKTGKLRGLLCQNCNLGIGNLKDDPSVILRALRYVQEEGTL